jgi:hypothetical protein
MIEFGGFDLWSIDDVRSKWNGIFNAVESGNMPPTQGPPDPCPEGGWDDLTRAQFLKDFQEWKDGGYQP